MGSAPTTNSTTLPWVSSATIAGVDPPQQSHAGQFGLNDSPKIVSGVAMPVEGGLGIGASPSSKASSRLL